MHPEWDSFFVAVVGAAAALAGLLFVAVSINVDQILRYPWLPGRAGGTIAMLVPALVMGGLALVPDQTYRQLGVEILVVALAVWALIALLLRRAARHPDFREHSSPRRELVLEQIATLPPVAAGVALVLDRSAGLGVLAFGLLATFVVAVANAWILLVEIRR